MERIFDGREHRIKSQCPECGHINNVRLQWKEQGAACPECSRVFRAVEHEVAQIIRFVNEHSDPEGKIPTILAGDEAKVLDIVSEGRYVRILSGPAKEWMVLVSPDVEVELLGAYDHLGYGHLGNGISVWNRAQEEHGDYVKVAHIDSDRKVTYYDDKLPGSIKEEIEQFAAKEDPAVSATQLEQKVFKKRPC